MNPLDEIQDEIKHYLVMSSKPELVARLGEIGEDSLMAVFNMLSDMQFNRVQQFVIAFNVKEDMMSLLEGREPEFSKPYLSDP